MDEFEQERLNAEVAAIRESALLGRSVILRRLFDYLASISIDERSPKEMEVAARVFGRPSSFDPGQDAVVRVYMHKLRRKLEAIYAGPRRHVQDRVAIPLGEYRLILASPSPVDEWIGDLAVAPAEPTPGLFRAQWVIAAIALMLLSSIATWGLLWASLPAVEKEVRAVRAGPVWSPVVSDGLPTLIAVGDYYIFGESDDEMQTDRLVREYSVNSAADLDQFLIKHPEKLYHYLDLNLRYLPVGSAFALRDIVPVAQSWKDRKATRIVLASDLTPQMLKANNIVYIGYLSGLGALRDLVFAGSRFTIGDTYDEIHDSRTRQEYDSQGGGPSRDGVVYRDYGYFSTFRGPGGNRIVIVAGTRDVGLMQTAEAMTSLAPLAEARRRAGGSDAFEALYQVEGIDRLNMSGKLIVASPLDVKGHSSPSGSKLMFPAG
jgi:hypothetical protein